MRDELEGATILATDELEGATILATDEPEKNPSSNQMAEFSSSIQDVMDAPRSENIPNFSAGGGEVYQTQTQSKPAWTKKYPLGLTYKQMEALIAGVAGVIGTSDAVQSKLSGMLPQFYSEATGKISMTGMAVLVLVVAVLFYFGKQLVMNR